MQIASWLLVTSTLAAPPAPATNATASTGDVARPAVSFAADQQRATIGPLPAKFSPARTFGLGGSLMVSNTGIFGSTRYFFNSHLGAGISAGWMRPRTIYRTYYTANQNPILTSSTVSASPIVVYSFNETDSNREVSLRPFVTAGAGYLHASRPEGQLPGPNGYSYTAVSKYASFGSEIFFRDHPNFALSAEAIYYDIPKNFLNRYYVDGMNFQISASFYLK
jgi:hypothetical protein